MIRWLITGGVTLGMLTIASAGHAAGERAFAGIARELLRKADPDLETRISAGDPLTIEIRHDGEWGESEIHLHRLHAFCAEATTEDCAAALDNLVVQITAEPPAIVAANLRLVVRGQAYLDSLREMQDENRQPIYRQIGEDLYALLAFAGPSGVLMAIPEHIGELELDEQAAWRLAGRQTRAMLPRLPKPIDIVREPVMIEQGDLLSSLLADTEAWRAIAEEVGPDLAVAATTDELVFMAALPPDYRRMRQLKQAIREDCEIAERCISPNIYRFRDGRWVIAE